MANSCKYYKQRREMSYDGVTWIPLDEYRKGDLVPGASSDCSSPTPTLYRWVQTENTVCVNSYTGKFKATYTGGTTYDMPCDGNTTLTQSDVRGGDSFVEMTDAEIGECVTSINAEAFNNCRSLTSITIPNTVTSFGTNAFYGCSALTSVDIPDSVTTIGIAAFYRCTGLTSVDIPNAVTSIGNGAFMLCSSLQSITLPTGLTSISNSLLQHCTSLQEIVIPSGVTNIGDYVFWGCSNLQEVFVLPTTPPTLGSSSFGGTYPIYVPAGSVDTYKSASGWSNYSSRIQAIS